jgi:hypothetical protein
MQAKAWSVRNLWVAVRVDVAMYVMAWDRSLTKNQFVQMHDVLLELDDGLFKLVDSLFLNFGFVSHRPNP